MHESKVDERMWAEAVNTAVYLKNHPPHKAIPGSTPEEKWTEQKARLEHLKVFGCLAQARVPVVLRKKLDSKSKDYIFIGYCTETKG